MTVNLGSPEDVVKVARAEGGGKLVAEEAEVDAGEGEPQALPRLRHHAAHAIHKLALIANLLQAKHPVRLTPCTWLLFSSSLLMQIRNSLSLPTRCSLKTLSL